MVRVDGGPGTQPAQNPGISNITQYGNPGGNGAFTLVAAEAAVVLLERMPASQVSQITQTNLLLEEMVNLSHFTLEI